MTSNTLKLYALPFNEVKTYLFAIIFTVGNIILPQLCHLLLNGGQTWLPIYFFTLIGAYKYGMKTGLLIAIYSPLINSAMFGMPTQAALPYILIKSVLLAVIAGGLSQKFNKISIALMIATVLGYQVLGSLAESIITNNLSTGIASFEMGIPGMLLQIFGGYYTIKYLIRN